MSGRTQESLFEEMFCVSLVSMSVSFEPDSEFGSSGEDEFHASASRRYKRILENNRKVFRDAVAEIAEPLVPLAQLRGRSHPHPGYVGLDIRDDGFNIEDLDMFFLEMCFETKPSDEVIDRLRDTLRASFKEHLKLPDDLWGRDVGVEVARDILDRLAKASSDEERRVCLWELRFRSPEAPESAEDMEPSLPTYVRHGARKELE